MHPAKLPHQRGFSPIRRLPLPCTQTGGPVNPRHLSKFAFVVFTLLSSLAFGQLQIGSSNTAFADPPCRIPRQHPAKLFFSRVTNSKITRRRISPTLHPRAVPAPGPQSSSKPISPSLKASSMTVRPTSGSGQRTYISAQLPSLTQITPATGMSSAISPPILQFSRCPDRDGYLFNTYNTQYNGLLHGSATLYFYPLAPHQVAA